MIQWIRNNKLPSTFVAIALIFTIIWGIAGGLGYISAKRLGFINSVKQGAIEGYLEYGVLPSLTISASCLESAYGASHIEHNLFGIKATSSWKGKVAVRRTAEYVNGKKIYINAHFRAYDSNNDSVADYAKFLASNKRYAKVVSAKDYKTAAYEIGRSGYATNPKYQSLILSIMNLYKLWEIDAEAKEIKDSRNLKLTKEQLTPLYKCGYKNLREY